MRRLALYGMISRRQPEPDCPWDILLVDATGQVKHALQLPGDPAEQVTSAYRAILATCELATGLNPGAFTLLVDQPQAVQELNRQKPVADEARALLFMLVRSMFHQFNRFRLYLPDAGPLHRLPQAVREAFSRRVRAPAGALS